MTLAVSTDKITENSFRAESCSVGVSRKRRERPKLKVWALSSFRNPFCEISGRRVYLAVAVVSQKKLSIPALLSNEKLNTNPHIVGSGRKIILKSFSFWNFHFIKYNLELLFSCSLKYNGSSVRNAKAKLHELFIS